MTETLPTFPMARATGCPFDPPPQLRELDPISRVSIWSGETPWLVTGYDEQRAVLADQRFSADSSRAGYPHQSAAINARRRTFRTFIALDDPEHDRQRKMLTRNFMVKRVDAMRPRVQQIVDGLIDDMLAGPQPADLVTAFALPVPSLVICELLGVPYEDHDFFQACSRKLISRESPPEEAIAANEALREYLLKLIAAKQQTPADDLIGRLVSGQVAEGELTVEEAADMSVLMLIAGHETTANMIALGTLALLEHPDQLAELRDTDDPALIANAVEELLRYLNIVHGGRRRVALTDVEVGGQLIRAGEGVILANDAGNRDDSAFPDPDVLDIHRKARHHVAFGYGVHQCLGQPLARMELQVVYSTLYKRIPTLRLAIPLDEVQFKHEMVVYGVHTLPVTW
ncbi:cytochrome P450 [Nocardia macrotermitis]|uniref:Cytochrome P450-SU2 n=1 Tax=Nocardia macrotermitis TaxID=2585198 RepID=A0A7K0D383_9NOCA|nr:cytochrome P450 [Nocardia macrotermitis]MQY20117.1 Cytochrome P450-SU2 [Nocardia macrotermitis]